MTNPFCDFWHSSEPWRPRPRLFAALLIFSCSGCWEEYQYEPSQEALPPPTAELPVTEEVSEEEIAVPTVVETPALEEEASTASQEQPVTEEPVADPSVPVADSEPVVEEPELEVAEQPVEPAEVAPSDPEPAQPPPTRSALASWRMASKWSFAAARLAKGQGPDRYGADLEAAQYAATLLEIELPALPADLPAEDREKMVISFLADEAGPKLSRRLQDRYDARHAALAEFAVKTHVLLLTYTPKSPSVAEQLSVLQRVAQDSELPSSLWQELLTLLEERAEFKKIKKAIYQLHAQVNVELSESRP